MKDLNVAESLPAGRECLFVSKLYLVKCGSSEFFRANKATVMELTGINRYGKVKAKDFSLLIVRSFKILFYNPRFERKPNGWWE